MSTSLQANPLVPLIHCDRYTAAYNARLERLGVGAFTDRDKQDEVYSRGKRVERTKAERDRKRTYRGYDRTNRENDEAKKLRTARFFRREAILWAMFEPIRDRVMVERKIRPPGKAAKSVHRWRGQLEEALAVDAEYQAYANRRDRFQGIMNTIGYRRPSIAAGILAVDDRATRHAKVRAYRAERGQA